MKILVGNLTMKKVLIIFLFISNICALSTLWFHIDYDTEGFMMILFWMRQIISFPFWLASEFIFTLNTAGFNIQDQYYILGIHVIVWGVTGICLIINCYGKRLWAKIKKLLLYPIFDKQQAIRKTTKKLDKIE